jgi:hypothetical protein
MRVFSLKDIENLDPEVLDTMIFIMKDEGESEPKYLKFKNTSF